jgi:dipeptidyl aminopeptidase/acylaminoacyl peptidase
MLSYLKTKPMKYINIFLLLLIFPNVKAQDNNLLVRKVQISDFSGYPIYPHLVQDNNGETKWKNEFKYLDSIEMYSISYLSDGLRINGFLVQPKKNGNFPCIIYNRGGNREFGNLTIATGITTMGEIAAAGYVVIASQYRGNGGSEGAEEFGGKDVNDVLILPEVLKEIEGADSENIGMFGWSRGGMMTYIALTKTNKIKAAAVGGAISDLYDSIKDRPEMETHVAAELIPNYATNKEMELEKRSAIKWADKFSKNVPILMLHGNADWRVKPEQSLNLALEFQKYKIPYRLIMIEGADHGISERRDEGEALSYGAKQGIPKRRDEVNQQVINWFDRFLKNAEPVPNMEYHGN